MHSCWCAPRFCLNEWPDTQDSSGSLIDEYSTRLAPVCIPAQLAQRDGVRRRARESLRLPAPLGDRSVRAPRQSLHGDPRLRRGSRLSVPRFVLHFGKWIERRHARKPGAARPHALTIDLSRPRDRRALVGFATGAVIFLLLTAIGSNGTYHYTESVQFCGRHAIRP